MPRALLEIEPHRQLVLRDFGLVRRRGGRGPPQQTAARYKAKHVASRLLDVNDLGAELRELGANIGLSDQLPGADRARMPSNGPNAGAMQGVFWSLQAL